jgi:hypothetical protein
MIAGKSSSLIAVNGRSPSGARWNQFKRTLNKYVSGPGGHRTSANDPPESAFRVMPERRVEFRRREIEHCVVGLVHARDYERV